MKIYLLLERKKNFQAEKCRLEAVQKASTWYAQLRLQELLKIKRKKDNECRFKTQNCNDRPGNVEKPKRGHGQGILMSFTYN